MATVGRSTLAASTAASSATCLVLSDLPVLVTGAAAATVYLAANLIVGPVHLKSVKAMLTQRDPAPAGEPGTEGNAS